MSLLLNMLSSFVSFPSKEQASFNLMGALIAQLEKNLPVLQETQVWFLGWEDPLVNYKLALTKIIADDNCNYEIKRLLLLGRKAMTKLDSILKSRDITLPTKEHLVKAMVFPVVMYGCDSWTIKKAEHRSIDAFELWCWRRLLRVPWTVRRSNQFILKEISPGWSF